jgi:hypothetical protein
MLPRCSTHDTKPVTDDHPDGLVPGAFDSKSSLQ